MIVRTPAHIRAHGVSPRKVQHVGSIWKTPAVALLAIGVGCLLVVAHAEADSTMRAERTSSFEVVLTIGPAQAISAASMQPAQSIDTGMSHDMSKGGHDTYMEPQQADNGMAVNRWLDVYITQADSDTVVSDVTLTIRIVDKSTGEAHDLGMSGSMSASDFHYGQNVFLPDGTYQTTVLLGPTDTAHFRDVVVASGQ